GEGRTLVWTSDIGPHWLPNSFVEWPGYARLWTNVLRWVSKAA
ncbi:MAG: cytoplasmic protein, partial [Mesorhizobium sp.]